MFALSQRRAASISFPLLLSMTRTPGENCQGMQLRRRPRSSRMTPSGQNTELSVVMTFCTSNYANGLTSCLLHQCLQTLSRKFLAAQHHHYSVHRPCLGSWPRTHDSCTCHEFAYVGTPGHRSCT